MYIQEARLHVAEQERLRAVHSVRRHLVQNNIGQLVEEKEEGWWVDFPCSTDKWKGMKRCSTVAFLIPLISHALVADQETADLYKASRTDLVNGCRRANKELHQHKLYLDQLLTIVIDKHPELLSMVTEAQKMRLARYISAFCCDHRACTSTEYSG